MKKGIRTGLQERKDLEVRKLAKKRGARRALRAEEPLEHETRTGMYPVYSRHKEVSATGTERGGQWNVIRGLRAQQ